MERAVSKAERLLQIEALLLDHPEGIRQSEIARRMGVNRSTVHRYLPDLTARFSVYETGDGRLAIDRDHYLMNVRLTMHESMALHLAARLMATRTDKRNPHASAALRKLGLALENLAPRVAQHLKGSAGAMESTAQRHDPVYLKVLETLTRAWSLGRKVSLAHQMRDGREFEYVFSPYFIEPYAVGRTTHAIGWREEQGALPGALRTFKLERIRRIELLETEYEIPADFDPREQLGDAWGIWYSDGDPIEVVLRFHPRVAGRVRESQWHASEQVEVQPDGYMIWRATIAEPQEMLPWIRGWGAEVEVLQPEGLRNGLTGEAARMAALYGIQPAAAWQLLWAKAERKSGETHPLICHLIDVAQVTRALWRNALPDGLREWIAGQLGLECEEAGRWLAFWAGLHDLGKACPAFQRKYPPAIHALEPAGLDFPRQFGVRSFPHGTATAHLLPGLAKCSTESERALIGELAVAIGGHHGAWPTPLAQRALRRTELGDGPWDQVRRDLVEQLRALFDPPAPEPTEGDRTARSSLLAVLSGLVSVADWIGSMERFFPFVAGPVAPAAYARESCAQAARAVQELDWISWQPPRQAASFADLFSPFEPRPMQQVVIELAEQLNEPSLVIIEAPTGTGKTEAALYLADRWAAGLQQRGLYIAMPTMATSNQMFQRLSQMLAHRYPDSAVRPLLIHSQARWMTDVDDLAVNTPDAAADMSWFLPRKRSLLAPFGVGTVDQALMSVLQARHFFVRLFGLSHKTVIFDEVHAYDTYMSAIFVRLLEWLRAVGASVVILSATLPKETRRRFLSAYAGPTASDAAAEAPEEPYPLITWAGSSRTGAVALTGEGGRTIHLEWVGAEPQQIAQHVAAELAGGGCIAIICNRVARAQEVYAALKESEIIPDRDLFLFHARFPFVRRDAIEREVLERFGKGDRRPERAVAVATQVIEQSLDLDFDTMITDLAPVDLLLQRAGRLHRHQRSDRPARLERPRLAITRPWIGADGVPDFGADTYVYERYVLLRTWMALQGRQGVTLPADTEALIETVYGERSLDGAPPELQEALAAARREMEHNAQADGAQAQTRMIPPPEDERLMATCDARLAEDRPELHQTLQALTRLIRPTVSLVCLHRVGGQLYPDADGRGRPVELAERPDREQTAELARRAVGVSHGGVVHRLFDQEAPLGWRDHPLLMSHRVAIFESGVCRLEQSQYCLMLDSELGLRIEKAD